MKKNILYLELGCFALIIVGFIIFGTNDDLGAVFIVLALMTMVFGPLFMLLGKYANKKKLEANELKEKYNLDENLWNIIIKNKFAVNETQKLLLINGENYSFNDILDAELLEDDNSIIKSSLIGTAAKGFMFGMPGLLSSSKKQKKVCEKLQLKITIKDLSNPVQYINFINSRIQKNSYIYKNAYENAQKCISIINIIVNNK
ncbi:MAG: hypothetical protein E7161_04390 [Firmicutes bacterium]|nr:hypothetical protein [Bacillota bacterium]